MKWVTRERPVIDRIACPWLIARFIDKEPEFLFVAPDQVIRVARETGATPYDVPGVEFTHVGDGCSFDTFVSKHGLDRDPAIVTIAAIVRGADTDRHDLTPQSAGLLAISMGLRDLTPDDHEVLKTSSFTTRSTRGLRAAERKRTAGHPSRSRRPEQRTRNGRPIE
ncbi:chromate resistance protein [Mesorhizobium sp. M0622]|uniref:chromate resistance protein ChrB domain-containing protein n=1 Tax=unclassified Mesorhizobium TaxID=325217 RepID=UPI003337627F